MAAAKLDWQAGRAMFYQQYYDLEAGIIALLDQEERQVFRKLLVESGANWSELIANAVAERLHVVGFHFDDEDASDAAWAIWQANSMDADSELVMLDSLVQGSSYVLVQADDTNPSGVSISPESAMQATVLYEPGSRRKRIAGYKRYSADAWSYEEQSPLAASMSNRVEVLILPDQIVTWHPGAAQNDPQIERNPAGVVGLVEMTPQPRTLGPPRSELHSVIAFQDRVQTTIFNRLVATDFGAFRTIWATGIRVAQDVIKTDTGSVQRVVRPFDLGANRLLANENPDGKFGAFPGDPLAGYLASVAQDVEHLSAITQTPPWYLTGTMINLAADAIRAAESGLVAKAGKRARFLGESWEEVARLALAMVGNAASADSSAEVVWADMETRSIAQLVDALVKLDTIGVPREVLWQKYGATPQEIEDWKAMKAAEPTPPPTQIVVPAQPGQPVPPEPAPPTPTPEPASAQ
jgi:hypothetical protein